jgi:integrase/recombinase XerD
VFYTTGGRLAEVHGLDKKDVDWQDGSARVVGKGDKERDVYLSIRAEYHLKKYLESRSDDCPVLFITERRPYRRLSKRGIQREIKSIAIRAGIGDKVHPHVLRHTFATLTLNNGAELAVLQQLLGHNSPVTTQVYAQVTDERKKQAHKKYLIQ